MALCCIRYIYGYLKIFLRSVELVPVYESKLEKYEARKLVGRSREVDTLVCLPVSHIDLLPDIIIVCH